MDTNHLLSGHILGQPEYTPVLYKLAFIQVKTFLLQSLPKNVTHSPENQYKFGRIIISSYSSHSYHFFGIVRFSYLLKLYHHKNM